MKTVSESIAEDYARFRLLSKSQQIRLRRKATAFISENPSCANYDGFWRRLSASHVVAASYPETAN